MCKCSLFWLVLFLVWVGLLVVIWFFGMVSVCAKFEGSSVRAKVWPGLVWFGSGLVWFGFFSANVVAWYGEYVCKV